MQDRVYPIENHNPTLALKFALNAYSYNSSENISKEIQIRLIDDKHIHILSSNNKFNNTPLER